MQDAECQVVVRNVKNLEHAYAFTHFAPLLFHWLGEA